MERVEGLDGVVNQVLENHYRDKWDKQLTYNSRLRLARLVQDELSAHDSEKDFRQDTRTPGPRRVQEPQRHHQPLPTARPRQARQPARRARLDPQQESSRSRPVRAPAQSIGQNPHDCSRRLQAADDRPAELCGDRRRRPLQRAAAVERRAQREEAQLDQRVPRPHMELRRGHAPQDARGLPHGRSQAPRGTPRSRRKSTTKSSRLKASSTCSTTLSAASTSSTTKPSPQTSSPRSATTPPTSRSCSSEAQTSQTPSSPSSPRPVPSSRLQPDSNTSTSPTATDSLKTE